MLNTSIKQNTTIKPNTSIQPNTPIKNDPIKMDSLPQQPQQLQPPPQEPVKNPLVDKQKQGETAEEYKPSEPTLDIDGLHNIHPEQIDDKEIKEFKLFYLTGVLDVVFSDNSFKFTDERKTFSKVFSIDNIFDYMRMKKQKLHPEKKMSAETINMLEISIFKKNDTNICEIYTNSPFMKDISIMRFLIKVLENYLREKFGIINFVNFDEHVNQKNKQTHDNLSLVIKFIYSIMEHTLNIFDVASKAIHEKKLGTDNVKLKLTRYSVGLIYKMMKYLNASILLSEKKYKNIIDTLDELKIVEDKLENKIILALNKNIAMSELK